MKKGWAKVPLGELLDIEIDAVPVDPSDTYPFAGVYGFGRGLFMRDSLKGSDTTYSHFHRLHEGQLVMSQPKGWEGAITVVPKEFEGRFLSSVFPTFRPREGTLSPAFLRLVTKCKWLWDELFVKSNGIGARRNSIYPAQLLEVQIPLPPLAEQQRIVAHLDAIESRLTRTQKLREEAGKEVAALFPQLLDKAMTPHGEGWRRETLAEVIESMDAGWSPQCDKLPASDGEWGVLKTTSVQWGEFRPQHNKALPSDLVPIPSLGVKEGDVLVTRAGPRQRVGVVAAVRRDEPRMTISDKIIRIRADRTKILPRFLELSLASPFSQEHLVQRKTGLADAQVNISQSILKGTPVAYPALSEQERIVGELDASRHSIDGLAHRQEMARLELSALLPSLLDQIFNS